MSAKPGDTVLQRLERDAAKATACALLESSASGHGPCRSEHLISRTSANVKPCVRQYGPAGFFQPGPVQVRQDALTCQHQHRHDLLPWDRRRRQCHPRAHQCDPRVNVQILTGQPITDGIGRASRERPASEV
jgi:hypothetical protein